LDFGFRFGFDKVFNVVSSFLLKQAHHDIRPWMSKVDPIVWTAPKGV
jgi:hypothetical protein